MTPRKHSPNRGQSLTPERPSLPPDLAVLPIDQIQPCPIQPRVNFAVDLITQLERSMREGRHRPLLEVEPAPGQAGRYQIVCGEQRWRAAKAAGLTEVLVRVHGRLGYLERLERQYEENHLRAALDPVESAAVLLLDHTIRCIDRAEQLLREATVPFEALNEKRVTRREEFDEHLAQLSSLLVRKKVHVVRAADGQPRVGPLAPWRDTEKALGVSESARKAKVGLLRLDSELQDEVRTLPAEHAIQISRLEDPRHQTALVRRAAELTHRQVRSAVERLRQDPDLSVDEALALPRDADTAEPLGFEQQLTVVSDLCRQLLRTLDNLGPHLTTEQRSDLRAVIGNLSTAIAAVEEGFDDVSAA